MKSSSSLIFSFLFLSFNISAQHIDNNSVNTLPIETNPALTGIFNSGNLNIGYQSFFNEYSLKASFANYQTHLPSINSGIGLNINYNDQGFHSRTSVGLAYAYQLDLNPSLGLSLGLGATYNDFNSPYFISNFYPPFYENRIEFNSGVVLHHNRLFTAISLNQINSLDLPFQLNAIYGHKFRIKGLELIPNIRYVYIDKYQQLEASFNINYKSIKGVISYEFNDSYSIGLGYHWSRISLQYTIRGFTSILNNSLSSYHQFGLQLKLPEIIKRDTKALGFRLF